MKTTPKKERELKTMTTFNLKDKEKSQRVSKQNITTDVPAVLLCDFYKISHRAAFPTNTTRLYATLTPRSDKYLKENSGVVVFGVQAFVLKYLIKYFNENFFWKSLNDVVNEYKAVVSSSLGLSFDEVDVDHIKELHELGYLPIEVKAIAEGTVVPIQTPILTVENTHDSFFWLPNYLETLLSAELWLPCTSATSSFHLRKMLNSFAQKTSDNINAVEFQAHDFSMRGMSSLESAMASGAAHLLSFSGTDCVPAIPYLQKYYGASKDDFIAGSIPATEHSVMCANTPADTERDEYENVKRIITEIYPTGLVSVVADTYDFWKFVTQTLSELKEDIMNRDGKVVIRPDCYDEETQILTNSGWKYFKDLIKEDLVAQVLDDGTYEFVKPLKYVNEHYKGEMIRFNDHHGKVDLLVTPNHRMIIQQTNRKTKETKERVIFAENMKTKGNNQQKMLRSAKAKSFNKELTDIERLRIAFQADGSYTTSGNKIRFSFSKERKMSRLESICYRAGVNFDKYDLSDGRVEYHLNTDSTKFQKDFGWVDIANLDGEWCADFIGELSYWDSTRRSDDRFKFDTTNKEVSDVVELISLSAGYGDLVSVFEDNREERFNTVYNHNILKKNAVGGQSWKKSIEQYDGNIYCVQVPTGRLIVKRGRGTMICGNSGNPADIICGSASAQAIQEGYDYMTIPSLEDCQDIFWDLANSEASRQSGKNRIGDEEYSYEFVCDGKLYSVKAEVDYNRYDKTFYYVESIKVKEPKLLGDVPKLQPAQKGLINVLWEMFGGEINSKGYKVLDSHIGVIYGDSITYQMADEICTRLELLGFDTTNVVLGIGGYTYQYKTRDSLGFAMKATNAVINGVEIPLMKEPKTDSNKKSQRGRVAVYRNENNEIVTVEGVNQEASNITITDEKNQKHSHKNLLQTVFKDGNAPKFTDVYDIRNRIKENL